MDGIQTYSAGPHAPSPIVATVHGPTGPATGNASAVKSPSDYLQAVRRRVWLVLLVAIPIASAGTLLVLRLPNIYSVTALISVEPPKTDPAIRNLVGSSELVINEAESSETYVPSALAILNSKSFFEKVLFDKALGLPQSFFNTADPAAEMVGKLRARIIPKSTNVQVTYEGRDPELITKILNHSLKKFEEQIDGKSRSASTAAIDKASETQRVTAAEVTKLDDELTKLVMKNKDIAPNGQNIKVADYEIAKSQLWHHQNQEIATRESMQLEAMKPRQAPAATAAAQKIALLEEKRLFPARRLAKYRAEVRELSDPAITRAAVEVQEIDQEIARLQRAAVPSEDNGVAEEAWRQMLANRMESVNATHERINTLNDEIRESMPVFQQFTTKTADRDIKAKQLASSREKLNAYRILIDAQKKPVEIIDMAATPLVPVRPNRAIYVAASIVLALGLGLGLVCLLEHIDHSVKVPEHLTAGLALPLFGVVPRMIRSARNHRGGHLWISGTPDSIEADAYRNLRASLLGATDGTTPIVTLLITSAKAGEGKSTTALNLAATCARAGERTLLMDVDLRRPSLNGVFPAQDHDHGLVDVLRGDLPWQRTIVQTDLPNLDFLPTGATRDVPIEVLGSLELRQLLLSLGQHHYDRVILDGPAVLGLADCRMLGRIVDAAVMVVRSGSQEIRSLRRAKTMLEQSRVFIAGLVFNSLRDDLANWSSYGPNPLLDGASQLTEGRTRSTAASMLSAAPVEV